MNKITARIVDKGGLWIFVDHDGDKTQETAMVVTEEELIPIKDAINSYIDNLKP